MERLFSLLIQLIPSILGEVIVAYVISLPNHNLMLAGIPRVKVFLDMPLYLVGSSNMGSALQDHHLEDDEPLHLTTA